MSKDMAGVMREFKHGELHSGSKNGPEVNNRKQAIAIGLSEQRQQGKTVPPKPKKAAKKRAAPVSRRRADGGQFDGPPAPPGMGPLSHRPRVLNNPKSLSSRRDASHAKAYPDDDGDDDGY